MKQALIAVHGAFCEARFGRYVDPPNNVIQLYQLWSGEPFLTASVNPEIALEADQVAIKDWSENTGVLKALVDTRIVSRPIGQIKSGRVVIHICTILVPKAERVSIL